MSKELFSIIAIFLTFVGYLPYIYSIKKGKTKPHVFSWLIWGITTFIVFLAQLEDKGGVGAWPLGLSGIITIYVAVLAYTKKSDISITKTDWVFLSLAFLSLPLWYFTSNPLWAVVILTTIDIIGFGPTLRKAFVLPYEENALFYGIFALRNVFAIFALEHYSTTTLLFPIATGIACLLLVGVISYQRKNRIS